MNIIILDNEISSFVNVLNRLANSGVDGVILQDFGMFYLLNKYFPTLSVHASTQVLTHNNGQVEFLKELGAERVNLSRELNIKEINQLTAHCHKHNILTEVFVHGSYCISFSGNCYMSSVQNGKSGNRGRCSQPCREEYEETENGSRFPLNLKDNSACFDVEDLFNAKVDSLKIEGRIKKFHYVYAVTKFWNEQLNRFYNNKTMSSEYGELSKVFNRGYSSGFLDGKISRDMYVDNPRDNAAANYAKDRGKDLEICKKKIYDIRTDIIAKAKEDIENLNIDNLKNEKGNSNRKIPFVEVPLFKKTIRKLVKPRLITLISDVNDTSFCRDRSIETCYELPNSLRGDLSSLIDLFNREEALIPWFPAILIGKDYRDAETFLKRVTPRPIVTNNSGIANVAFRMGISWIAGPFLNIVNSYSLLCLKEKFNCSGAFISNEINKGQIERINCPENFDLYYSMYHPIELMTSRQCLFQTITGCEKLAVDDDCLGNCEKYSIIKKSKYDIMHVNKTRGSYNHIYSKSNFLNLKIITDIPNMFSGFMVDLRRMKTGTTLLSDNYRIVEYFKRYLAGDISAKNSLEDSIQQTTEAQYKKGI